MHTTYDYTATRMHMNILLYKSIHHNDGRAGLGLSIAGEGDESDDDDRNLDFTLHNPVNFRSENPTNTPYTLLRTPDSNALTTNL